MMSNKGDAIDGNETNYPLLVLGRLLNLNIIWLSINM